MAQERRIGRYVVRDLLGQGAMGSVYKAYDPNLEREVAIKTMRASANQRARDKAEFQERFFREARVNGRLNHPNIVAVYDSGIFEEEPFLIMEYVVGQPLDRFAEAHDREHLGHYLDLLADIAAGLDFAHDEGVIHRDIKPGNVLVATSKGRKKFRAKILDFGLAKLKDSKLTQTGYFLGTPSYASPEQVIHGRIDGRSDIYSFGTMAYELLTGLLPFESQSLHSILYQIAHAPPNLDLDQFAEHLDVRPLLNVFQTMLDKDPAARYQTATEFVADLRKLLAPLGHLPRSARQGDDERTGKREVRVDLGEQAAKNDLAKARDSERTDLVTKARNHFSTALKTRNLSAVRFCLRELRALEANVSAEEKALQKLENQVAADDDRHKRENRHILVEKAREEFQMALKTENPDSVRFCLKQLISLEADVHTEKAALAELEARLRGQGVDGEREQLRQRLVGDARDRFRSALQARDLDRCRRHLDELVSLKADVREEREAMRVIESRQRKEVAQREDWVQKVRQQFQDAHAAQDLRRCGFLITELESLLKVDASAEKAAFSELQDQRKQVSAEVHRHNLIDKFRKAFSQAIAEQNVAYAEANLGELQHLQADVDAERDALADLRQSIREEQRRQQHAAQAEELRQQFRSAMNARDLDTCRQHLQALRGLVDSVDEEEQALARFQSLLREHEAEKLKRHMIKSMRKDFRKALARTNLEHLHYYLRELKQLDADVSEEEAAIHDLERERQARHDARLKAENQARYEFQVGLERGDPGYCEQNLKLLRDMGADANRETRELALLENEILRERKLKLSTEAEEKLVAKMIEHFRFEFLAAFKSEQIDNCRYFVEELKQLGADVESECEAIELLDVKLRNS